MVYSLTWLPAVLEAAGLKVAEVTGWATRGRAEMGQVLGVMCHHTAGPAHGNMPSLDTLVKGRSDLPGPLAQLGLGRDGTYYVIAAGRCNHAGAGSWKGLTRGNQNFVGIEAENTGLGNDPWPAVQMDAYHRGVAAILRYAKRSVDYCCGHKEYALPPKRKPDPSFDMDAFRVQVAAWLNRSAPPPALIPPVEPKPVAPGGAPRLTLRRGSIDPFVQVLQTKLKLVPADGAFGPKTEARLREFQREQGLVPDGICGPKTWAKLDLV